MEDKYKLGYRGYFKQFSTFDVVNFKKFTGSVFIILCNSSLDSLRPDADKNKEITDTWALET